MSHFEHLHHALELANKRRGFCAPNPSVGAVIVKNNKIIGSGFHFANGHPHAEVIALQNISESAKDATLYVTLEPCCHREKKTPPCVDLLIKQGIKKVFYGYVDPNPSVSGKSKTILAEFGIECTHLPLPEIDTFYASYHYWWQHQKPVVTAKLALTLDGKIAGAHGQRLAITDQQAQIFTHIKRKQADAILTTAKTIRQDDPLLNVRLPSEEHKKSLYILDRNLTTPLTAKIFNSAQQITLLHDAQITKDKIEVYSDAGVRCFAIPSADQQLCLKTALTFIGQDGVQDLWVEAGGKCFTSLVKQKLLHYAFIFVSPKCFGPDAQNAFSEPLMDFDNITSHQWHILDQDVLCEIKFEEP